jgi:hypothetical protein
MEVTIVGLVCMVLGVLNLARPVNLTCWLAAAVTFSATAVINVPAIPFGFQPYHWFGVLLIISTLMLKPRALVRSIFVLRGGALWLIAFLLWGILAAAATGLSGTSIAHMVHLTLGAAIMFSVVVNCKSIEAILLVVQWLVAGALAAALWGVLQFVLFILGVDYPVAIFNNSVGEFAIGFDSTVLQGFLPRINSVATEPSYLVRSLVPVMALMLTLWALQERTLKISASGPLRDIRIWIFVLICLLSTSTLGLVGLSLLGVGLFVWVRGARTAITALGVAMTMAVTALVISLPMLNELADELLFGKLELGSGLERVNSVSDALSTFSESPFFGAGPGLVTSHDLVVKLLSNFGFFGAVAFLTFLIASARSANRVRRRTADITRARLAAALIAANIILWLMDAAAGVSYQYGIFWILMALLLSVSREHTTYENSRLATIGLKRSKATGSTGLGHYNRS